VEPGEAVEDMDKFGVATSIASSANPSPFGDDAKARALARDLQRVRREDDADYPGRFGCFAILPLPTSTAR